MPDGSTSPEITSSPQTAEQKTYLPDQQLTEQERRAEGEKLIRGFTDILREDPNVQRALADEYFRYNFASENDTRYGNVAFRKGTAYYSLNTVRFSETQHDPFYISRTEGGIAERLKIDRGWRLDNGKFSDKPSIEYAATNLNQEQRGFRFESGADKKRKTSGLMVIKGRELLAKVQEDFGKTVPPSTPNPASSQ